MGATPLLRGSCCALEQAFFMAMAEARCSFSTPWCNVNLPVSEPWSPGGWFPSLAGKAAPLHVTSRGFVSANRSCVGGLSGLWRL